MSPFRIKPSLVPTPISEHVSFSDEGPLLETLEFFETSLGSYQPLSFFPYLSLSAQYSIVISLIGLLVAEVIIRKSDLMCLQCNVIEVYFASQFSVEPDRNFFLLDA